MRIEPIFEEQQIQQRVAELAERLYRDYADSPLTLLCIAEGARRFVDDLAGSHEIKGGVEYSRLWLPDEGYCSTGTPRGERCVAGVPGYFFTDSWYDGPLPILTFIESIV